MTTAAPALRRSWVWRFLTILGPGIIVMTGDNEVGGFATYTTAGAGYGFNEMVVRLGCATGIGHAAMIFRRFGPAWGSLASSLNQNVREAPVFYSTYAVCPALAGVIVLVILPVTIVFLNLLLNDKELLGPNLVNKPWQNAVNWSIIGVLFVLSAILAAQTIAPTLFPRGS